MNKLILVVVLSFLVLLPSCRLYKLERQLDPENTDFLSKVKYIITSKERKIFLELPNSEKEEFKKEFWERRDPDPDTEENEFKMEYFKRIERANGIFLGEGKPGWLTDRGRIFILFGPPTDRMTSPGSGRCEEVWYYGNFPVIFFDRYCNGSFKLVTINLSHLMDLNLAQAQATKTFRKEKAFFDFSLSYKKILVEEGRFEGIIIIEIPYSTIWFKAEDERLATTFDVRLELKDTEKNLIWDYEGAFDVEIEEIELHQKSKKSYKIEIPFAWDGSLEKFNKRKSQLHIHISNRSGGEESKKAIEFILKSK